MYTIKVNTQKRISFFDDARHFQIAFLSFFLLVVLYTNPLDIKYIKQIILTFSSCLATQFAFTYATTKNYSSIKSALITSLGLSLLLKVNHIEWVVFAGFIAIASKFIIKYQNKHIFNPANIGVIATILISNDAWISPGQWGSNAILLFTIGSLGYLVIKKAERIDIALAFLFTYGGLLYARNIFFLEWPIDFWLHQLTNGTLMLFTFFMITDPMTTPNNKWARIIFAILLSVIAFYLATFKNFYTAPIWVLFFLSPTTILFDKLFKQRKFEWIKK